jgi:methyl-accepting chemotaxis protein
MKITSKIQAAFLSAAAIMILIGALAGRSSAALFWVVDILAVLALGTCGFILARAADAVVKNASNEGVKAMERDIRLLAKDVKTGVSSRKPLDTKRDDALGDIARGVNTLLERETENARFVSSLFSEYALGNFNPKPAFDPKTDDLRTETLRKCLACFMDDVSRVADAFAKGDFTASIDVAKYKNAWRATGEKLNAASDEARRFFTFIDGRVLEKSQGNTAFKEGGFNGAFSKTEAALNRMFSGDSDDMLRELYEVTGKDFSASEKANGTDALKSALRETSALIGGVLSDVRSEAKQASSRAKRIGEMDDTLSRNLIEQAEATEKVIDTINSVTEHTRINCDNAKSAKNIALLAKDTASAGKDEMSSMLAAMSEIKNASGDISRVIKVIDEIAFQTNILALNAAIEAARAGRHGVGFAVVAEEVRSLAARSQGAVGETTDLIHGAVNKVGEGMRIAGATSDTLNKIVDSITEVAVLADNASAASEQQEIDITSINAQINQISQAARANAGMSEESAALSAELIKNANALNGITSRFAHATPANVAQKPPKKPESFQKPIASVTVSPKQPIVQQSVQQSARQSALQPAQPPARQSKQQPAQPPARQSKQQSVQQPARQLAQPPARQLAQPPARQPVPTGATRRAPSSERSGKRLPENLDYNIPGYGKY